MPEKLNKNDIITAVIPVRHRAEEHLVLVTVKGTFIRHLNNEDSQIHVAKQLDHKDKASIPTGTWAVYTDTIKKEDVH